MKAATVEPREKTSEFASIRVPGDMAAKLRTITGFDRITISDFAEANFKDVVEQNYRRVVKEMAAGLQTTK